MTDSLSLCLCIPEIIWVRGFPLTIWWRKQGLFWPNYNPPNSKDLRRRLAQCGCFSHHQYSVNWVNQNNLRWPSVGVVELKHSGVAVTLCEYPTEVTGFDVIWRETIMLKFHSKILWYSSFLQNLFCLSISPLTPLTLVISKHILPW